MADKQLDVVVICGSLRKGSYNAMVQRLLPSLAPDYLLIAQRSFGPRRSLMLWQARDHASPP